MAIIGKITEEIRHGKPYHSGYISTLALNLLFELRENLKGEGNSQAPTHVIVTQNARGDDVQVGAGWLRMINKPGKQPFEVLSLTFDDPSFPQALNVAAFKNEDGSWDISFRRRQDKQAA